MSVKISVLLKPTMFSHIEFLGIDFDRVFVSSVSFAVIYFVYYEYFSSFGTDIVTALFRGVEFAIIQALIDVLIRHVDLTSIDWIISIKNNLGVDLLSSVLMGIYTSYMSVGEFFNASIIISTTLIGLASDMLSAWIEPIFNHEAIVGQQEAITAEVKRKKKHHSKKASKSSIPAFTQEEPSPVALRDALENPDPAF